jgi:signal peptidase II
MLADREVLLAPTAVGVVVFDQVLKAAVLRAGRALQLGPLLRIRSVRSANVAASALGLRTTVLALTWLGITLMVLFVVPHSDLFRTSLSSMALGAALGGAASNLLDLAVRGAVIDYVDLRVWPVFNLGDAAIVSGVLVAFIAG